MDTCGVSKLRLQELNENRESQLLPVVPNQDERSRCGASRHSAYRRYETLLTTPECTDWNGPLTTFGTVYLQRLLQIYMEGFSGKRSLWDVSEEGRNSRSPYEG